MSGNYSTIDKKEFEIMMSAKKIEKEMSGNSFTIDKKDFEIMMCAKKNQKKMSGNSFTIDKKDLFPSLESNLVMSAKDCHSNEKNRCKPDGSDDSEIIPMLLKASVKYQDPSLALALARDIQKIDREIMIPDEYKDIYTSKGNDPVTWMTAVIPPASSEYRRSRMVFEVTDPGSLNFAQNIKQNIMNCLQVRSIHAVYDGATADCKTSSYMKFTIRLLRHSKNTDTIMVDVRKRIGCAIAFRDEYQAIYHAAVHGEIKSCQIPCNASSSFADMEFMQGEYIPLEKGIIERSLETSIIHLNSKMHDTCVLTLQDLLSMTDSSSKETSSAACKLILEKYPKIIDYVVSDIIKKVDYSECGDDDTDEYLRSLTLNLLGNVLSSTSSNTSTATIIKEKINDGITESLVWYAEKASICPWNACLAVKCLRLFWPLSAEVVTIKAVQWVKYAEEVGKCSHNLLEKEAGVALIIIRNNDQGKN